MKRKSGNAGLLADMYRTVESGRHPAGMAYFVAVAMQ
jgi:hypothetical protein